MQIEQTHALPGVGQVIFIDSGDRVLMAENNPGAAELSLADLESGDEFWLEEEHADVLPLRRVGRDRFAYAARNHPDGDHVAVRRLEDFELLATFQPGSVGALASDAVGARIAVAGREGALSLWDAASGRRLTALPDCDPPAEVLAYSADGQWLLARDMAFDVLLHELREPAGSVRRLGLSDGVALACHPHLPLAAVDLGGRIAVYDLPTARKLRELGSADDRDDEAASELCFSPDGSLLLSGSLGGGALALWDFEAGRLLSRFGKLGAHVSSLAFHADCRRFAACRADAGAIFVIAAE